ncbi:MULTISPECIES: MBL fold metallo-hydrolase [Lachnospiraceae]|jgi:glyoxylase-like metal-dependent hydrolase (beta-lactamase superfamily II)|uniref:MBL fold metallo-hydrolase n=1 Tax=Candidatus Galacturonatibacter soehngenii TaxID=2307010 RepID=A0A7V7QJN7_9FIRM|nr:MULTISPECIES: MBL fold metallo-hydrolase [Lachnospiraceae]KAB1437491.1 MBL fold metallo-hydrolase [Candidatus Galacturonibacter soehngenii]
MIKLRYGNTNTFYIAGAKGGLLIDTDYAGTLPQFFKAIKTACIDISDISYMLATHYHPDHIGIVSELQKLGVTLLIVDVQHSSVHFADDIFFRDKRLNYKPIDENVAKVISCAESRSFLCSIGISGEIIYTPSHSEDSVSIILDDGNCIVGDLEPVEYLAAYDHNPRLKSDWEQIMSYHPKRILSAHANEKEF